MTDSIAKRVLIVEDEALLALALEEMLTTLGHSVIGLATRIDQAIQHARNSAMDIAVLDINVAGIKSFPVADILRQRGVPFIFATGYGTGGLMDGYLQSPTLQKPYSQEDLEDAIAEAMYPSAR